MKAEHQQSAVDPRTKPADLSRESAQRLLESTSTIGIYYYSIRKPVLILHSHGCSNVVLATAQLLGHRSS